MATRPEHARAQSEVSPASLMQLATAYWGSQTLFAANRLGLFELLDKGPRTSDSISDALRTDPHRTRLLLNSCVGLDLMIETEDGYANSAASDAFLVPGKPGYLGNAIHYSDEMAAPWSELERSVREGVPTVAAEDYLGRDKHQTRHFVYGMHERALGIGRALTELIDLSGRRQMLDVGGGPGTYSALFTRRFPGLKSTVIELPGIAKVAAEILDDMKAGDTVRLIEGSFHTTEFPAGNDVVLCSGIMHRETKASCRSLVTRAIESLEPGGLLIVSDVFSDPGGTSPPFAALFGLNMALSAPDGGVHSDSDMHAWMAEAGCGQLECLHFPPPLPHRAIVGRKP